MKKNKALIYKTLIVLFNIFLLIILVWITTLSISSSPSFYTFEFIKNNTPSNTSFTIEELNIISKQIIDYLFGKADSMQVMIKGQTIFSQQALIHMADVKTLYRGGIIIGWIVLVLELGILGILIYKYQDIKDYLLKTSLITIGSIIGIAIVILLLSTIDFDQAFTLFHKIIFPNEQKFNDAFFGSTSNYPEDPWINNLLLITILDINLFMDVGLIIAAVVIVGLALWMGIMIILHKRNLKAFIKDAQHHENEV